MTEGRERWQLALSDAGSSAPWGGQYSIRTQQFRVAAEALPAHKELALLYDPAEGGLCSRVTRLFVQCKGGVGDRCAHPQCDTHPSFGFEGGPATRCSAHQLKDMVDVRSVRCSWQPSVGSGADPCKTQASFGFEGGPRTRCSAHQLKGMVRKPKRRRSLQREKGERP